MTFFRHCVSPEGRVELVPRNPPVIVVDGGEGYWHVCNIDRPEGSAGHIIAATADLNEAVKVARTAVDMLQAEEVVQAVLRKRSPGEAKCHRRN